MYLTNTVNDPNQTDAASASELETSPCMTACTIISNRILLFFCKSKSLVLDVACDNANGMSAKHENIKLRGIINLPKPNLVYYDMNRLE